MFENFWAIGLAGGSALVVISLVVFFVSRYKRCPANQVLVISGKTGSTKTTDGQEVRAPAKVISGGGAFIWPIIQEYDFLDLTPWALDIKLSDALSLENIRVAVPTTVTVAISRDPDAQQNAAVRLLGLDRNEISALAQDLVVGQMRQVIASMRIEEINRDRESFLKKIDDSLEPELKKVGLYPINVNIQDIKDASGYIEATGRKAASQAVNQANADVAEQEKFGAVKVADAKQEKEVRVAQAARTQEIGIAEANQEKEVKVAEALRTKEIGIASAQKDRAIQVAEFNREQTISVANAEAVAAEGQAKAAVIKAQAFQKSQTADAEAKAAVEVARNKAQAAAARANAERVEQEKRAELEAVARAEAAKVVVDAEAAKTKAVLEAEAAAAQIFAKLEAEAKGQLEILNARAEGMRRMVEAAGGADAAYKLLMVDNVKYVADASAKAISGIKFDKVMVWGGSEGGEVPKFINSVVKSMVPLMDVVNELTDVKVPGLKTSETKETIEVPVDIADAARELLQKKSSNKGE